jgi:SAM-dependent methyltransferase
MKNVERWTPTKYALCRGRLTAGPAAGAGSWLIARLVAQMYERHLYAHVRGRLLDLGCGTVPLYEAYRDLVSSVTCVDWNGAGDRRRHVDVEHDLSRPLPFERATYDTVVLSDVLEHVPRPEALLAEVSRILSDGGKLLLNVPFLYWLHEQPHDYYRYTEHALKFLIRAAGLELVLLEPVGGAVEVVADVTAKHIAQLPVIGAGLAGALQRVAFAVTSPQSLRHALQASRQRFPLGYFVVAVKPAAS